LLRCFIEADPSPLLRLHSSQQDACNVLARFCIDHNECCPILPYYHEGELSRVVFIAVNA
jgi:hypothetical protein